MKKSIIAFIFSIVLIQSVFAAQVFVLTYGADSSTEKFFTLPNDYPDFLRGTLDVYSEGAYSVYVNDIFIGSKDSASRDLYSVVYQGNENNIKIISNSPVKLKVDISDKARIQSDAVICTTLNTGFVGQENGIIGCDVNVLALDNIDLTNTYCVGEKSNNKFNLVPDAFGRPNRYYATLTDLGYDERVKVVVASTDGTQYTCSPDLNTMDVDTSCPSKDKLSSDIKSCLSQGRRYDMFVDNTDCRRVRCLGISNGYGKYVPPEPVKVVPQPVPQQSKSFCSDSDDGRNTVVQGTTNGKSVFPDEGVTSKIDYCIQRNSDGTFNLNQNLRDVYSAGRILTCGQNCAIQEYYCATDTIVSDVFDCMYGCSNGACLPKSTTTTPVEVIQLPTNQTTTNVSQSTTQPEVQPILDGTVKNQTQEVQPVPTYIQQPTPEPKLICGGCSVDDKCLSIGTRDNGKYCSIYGAMAKIRLDESVCSNNFECSSNICINDRCVSGTVWQKFLNWFNALLGTEKTPEVIVVPVHDEPEVEKIKEVKNETVKSEKTNETEITCPSDREVVAQFDKCRDKGVDYIKKTNENGCIVVECLENLNNNVSQKFNKLPQSE